MLVAELINNNIPRLQLQDTVSKARQLINDFKLTHLPVVSENKFLGLISEEDLLDVEDEKIPIELIQENLASVFVFDDIHFLNAISVCNQYDTSVVPILNKIKGFVGVVTVSDLLKVLGSFTGANEIGGIIVLEMERSQFAISEISRIVESNDSTILHLNTMTDTSTGILTVTLHINNREISAIVASFERYDYNVRYHFGAENFSNEIEDNYKNLMNYLNL
jgi:acetoin utilization protein AcuB